MNPSFNGWSERGIPFADAMARAAEFGVVRNGIISWDQVPLIPWGQLGEGWPDLSQLAPGETAGARIFNNMAGTMPDGRVKPYVLTWEGTGACRLRGRAVVSEYNRTSNRVLVFIDPTVQNGNSQLIWEVASSSASDPVRNAHVWLPGTAASRPVVYLPYAWRVKAMNGTKGPHTWRTLDWTRVNDVGRTQTNGAYLFDFDGRIRTTSPSQGTRRGVSPEYQVAFCNAVRANLHYNIPHRTNQMDQADYDRFVRDVLVRIRDGAPAVPGVNGGQPFAGLAPGLTVTIELSNEIWNNGFPVHKWMKDQADQRGIRYEQVIAEEAAHVFTIADSVFSGADAPRLRKYVGGWIGSASFLRNILQHMPADMHIDAIGSAGYFGPRNSDVAGWLQDADITTGDCPNCPTAQEVVDVARAAIPSLAPKLRAHRNLADSWVNPDGSSPELVLYEAGQSFVAGYQPWGQAANAAQRLPDLFYAYTEDLIPMFVSEGVDQVNWYSFMTSQSPNPGGGNGPFGIWDSMAQLIQYPVPAIYADQGAPKAAAVYKGPPKN